MLQYKTCPFEVKIDEAKNEFEGYASVFLNVDSYADEMQPGAFKNTLRQDAQRVKVLYQHSIFHPIGKPLVMEEDSKGLYVRAKVAETTLGKDTIILMKDGVIDELSIGYTTIRDEWDKANNKRKLHEVKLWEFSPVTFGANELAKITDAKNVPIIAPLLQQLDLQLKAGKVLSEKNRNLVVQAIDALKALLDEAGSENEQPDDETVKGIMDIANQISQFAKGGI